jgi:hypothetical protein
MMPETGEIWRWIGVGPAKYLLLSEGKADSIGYVFTAMRLDKTVGEIIKVFWNFECASKWERLA